MVSGQMVRIGAMPGERQAGWQRCVSERARLMGSLGAQCREIAQLFEQRMKVVEESNEAAFLGWAGPWDGLLELLFIARPSFAQCKCKCIWVDISEGGYGERGWGGAGTVSSTWSVASDDAVMERVNILLPSDVELKSEFSSFLSKILGRPLNDSFYEANRSRDLGRGGFLCRK